MLPVDLKDFIETVGYIGIWLIIFAETGLLVGFFLPGDSLLFTAGFLASEDILNLTILIPVCFTAAVIGDAVGYAFGNKVGRGYLMQRESRFMKQEHLIKAEAFFERHGGKSIILGRFIPIVRTFVPVVAGMSAMKYPQFLTYNVIGAVLWAIGLPVAGFYLGQAIPDVDKYLLPIILVIITISILPTTIHIWRENGDEIKAGTRRQLAFIFGENDKTD